MINYGLKIIENFYKFNKMKIFPAIDIKDKKCVRLIKGDFDNKTENSQKSQKNGLIKLK